MSKTQPARGMRDFLPADVRKRNYVIGIIKEVYESYGFEPLETPSVENLETLTGKYGEEGNQLIFKILKRGEKLQEELAEGKIKSENELSDLALRYDLTVPLARVVANYKNELPKFFKRYQIQPVWRADRPARGRYREFYQCDVDAIGSNSMLVEAELCAAVSEILQKLGFDDFEIRVNHREILRGILELAGVSSQKQTDVLIALDKLDKIGQAGVFNELRERQIPTEISEILIKFFTGFSALAEDSLNTLNEIISTYGSKHTEYYYRKLNEDPFNQAKKMLRNLPTATNAVESLEKIIEFSKISGRFIPMKFDPSLARGLSYYTGAIFEINVLDLAGSLGGGGRYDGLIGMFGKEQIPACGFSLGLERILVVMEERGMFQKLIDEGKLEIDSADVLVTIWTEETAGESLKLANELRKTGLRVLVYPEADKLGKQFKYADSLGIKTAIILRDEEIAENKIKVKNLQTSEEIALERGDIAEKLKDLL